MLKFRPSLTLPEIDFIIGKICASDDVIAKPIIRKLEVFTLKAQHGITKASHLSTGKKPIDEVLGFSEDSTIETLLDQYNQDPSVLSKSQLAKVAHHRYVNDLMTQEEEAGYEYTHFK